MLVRRNHGGGRHSYYADGVAGPPGKLPGTEGLTKLPGVTSILDMMPKPGLIKWSGETTANYAVDNWDELSGLKISERLRRLNKARFTELDKAARRGTEVHRLAEQLVAGREITPPEELAAHVDSYVKFLDEYEPEPIAMELVVINRTIGYCGTADLVCHIGNAVWLLDLTTSKSGIFPEKALQVCAYEHAETYAIAGDEAKGSEYPLAELGIERCGGVHVRADGYDLRPLETGPSVWEYFKRLALNYAADEETKTWVGEADEPPWLRAAS